MPGTSPDSYGMNVARMALVPNEIVDHAELVAKEFTRIQEEKRGSSQSIGLSKLAFFKELMQGDADEAKLMLIWKCIQ